MDNTSRNIHMKNIIAALTVIGLAIFSTAPEAAAKATKSVPSATAKSTESDQASSDESDLRLALAKVNLEAETGNIDEAFEMLEAIEARHPNNPEVLAVQSDLYMKLENRGMAFADAGRSGPFESQMVDSRQYAALLAPQGVFTSVGFNERTTNEAVERMETLSGQMAIASGLALSANLQNDYVKTKIPFLRTNGTLQSFYGDRQQGTVTADKMFNDGQEILGSVYAVANNAGVGAQYRLWDHWGATSIAADYNKPEIDYVEMAVQHGTTHDVTVERKQIISQDLQAKLDGKYTIYAMDGDSNAAEAPGWNFDFDYNHPFDFFGDPNSVSSREDEITLGAHYTVDAEYFTRKDRAISNAGIPYNTLPVTDYEVHAFTASASKDIISGLKAEISGGIAVNRLVGTNGPIYGFLLNYAPIKELGIGFHATRNLLGGQNSGEKENNIGVDVKWMW
jgi:hypothetical protein